MLDIGLPGMDGYEVVAALRREGHCPDVCFIAVTGYGQDQDRARSLEAGFAHHLVKPVEVTTVLGILRGLSAAPDGP
jgi:CheY-like chemotaxis protein